MARRQHAVRLGIPALVVTALTIAALWRVGDPSPPEAPATTAGEVRASGRSAPLTAVADVLTKNAVGRQAAIARAEVRQVTSARTFWFGPADGEAAFAVLDPDVRRAAGVNIEPGAVVTLIGLVRPSPPAAQAMRQWQLDEPAAGVVEARGTYLHVTEVR